MEMKICKQCDYEKPLTDFYYNKWKSAYETRCKECTKSHVREYNKINKDKIKIRRRKHYLENSERIKERVRKYRINNREKSNANKRKYRKQQRQNPTYRLLNNFRGAVWRSLRENKNGEHWEDIVGYSINDLKLHLEANFKDGMTWENYGKNGWEVDHIIPVSMFNINNFNSPGFKKAWALENLQPMWAEENQKKGNKIFY